MTINGLTGEIRWSYLTAATFGPWRLITNEDRTARLQGRVVSVDHFRASQATLTAVLQIGRLQQRRAVSHLQIIGDQLTADLGPMENTKA